MAITISGENNNDRILASDGVIDSLSGFNVVGVVTATSFTGDLTGDVIGNLTGNVTGNINNTTLLLQTGGTERIRIDSSGRVLIGTTNEGNANADDLTVANSGEGGITIRSGSSANGNIFFSDATSGAGEYAGFIDYKHALNAMSFGTGGSERLRIDSSGNVNQTITASTQGFNQTASGDHYIKNVVNANRSSAGGSILALHGHWNGKDVAAIKFRTGADTTNKDDAHICFETSSANNITERLRIDSSGRVMIGNTDAGSLYASGNNLVVGSGSGSEGITVYTGNSNQGILAFADGTSGGAQQYAGYMIYDHNTNNMLFATQATERLRITSGGQVQLPTNGQQLIWGSSQQMKFYYENSEERMYLQGDGAYGFAFRVNSGNRLEISKTTGDIVMQGSSGRNFQWDNSEYSLYLTDNGSNSARLKIGSGADLQLYHDVSGNINHITAATNGTIKISGGVEFWDYTGVTKRAVIDSNGLRIGAVSTPTLPTTGKPPMIMRNQTHFTKEIHRTISDYRGLCDGTHSGYLLLIPAYPGSGSVSGKKFYGTITCDRGSSGSGNSTQVATVHASTAYQDDKFFVDTDKNAQYIIKPAKVTYNGTQYLALKFGQSGGGPNYGIHIDGHHRGTDSNFLRIVRQNEIDSVQNDNHGAIANTNSQHPVCGFMAVDMDGTPLNDNSIRYMRGGTVHFEYSPAGEDCYDNGIFTARVNGIYHVTCGFLTGNNVNRVEAAIQRKVSGGSFQSIVNLNGAGNFSNSHNGPTATAFIKMKAGWQLRVYRISSNQGAYSSTHGNNYFGAVLMHGLMDGQV